MNIGLRIDVDTLRGTRLGVPRLCRILAQHNWTASFFFSVGPDNMGRHLWRLLRPAFLLKMIRSNAPTLYGWDILLRGTFWRGPLIGQRCADVIRAAFDAGHEIGLHAWDHQAWQARIDQWSSQKTQQQIQRGYDALNNITGHPPQASAAPGWRCTPETLLIKDQFKFKYNSDCRGATIFQPCVAGRQLSSPQVPVNLPTYDELIGHNNITPANYNQHLLKLIQPNQLNVLTIHAEVEGGIAADMFADFVTAVAARGWRLCPLGELLTKDNLPLGSITRGHIPGRAGWVAVMDTPNKDNENIVTRPEGGD